MGHRIFRNGEHVDALKSTDWVSLRMKKVGARGKEQEALRPGTGPRKEKETMRIVQLSKAIRVPEMTQVTAPVVT